MLLCSEQFIEIFYGKLKIVVMKPIDKVARQTVEPSWLLREGSQFMSVQTTGA